MDAIEFYHTDECSTDIYEAMEQYNKHKSPLLPDEVKTPLDEIEYLIAIHGIDKKEVINRINNN